MNHVIYVYLIVFTAILAAAYLLMQRFVSQPMAFALSVAAAVALMIGLYGLREGANFDMQFQNMNFTGEFQMQADSRPNDATRFRLQPGVQIQSGRTWGFLNQAL
jgi:hypothetical protein